MAFAVIAEIPGGTLEQYDAVAEAMGFEGSEETSHGLLVHLAGLAGDTLIVIDLWESREAYQRHLAELGEKGREAVRKAGLPPYTHREFEVYSLVK
jgi:quinol monooxygenase YgiN